MDIDHSINWFSRFACYLRSWTSINWTNLITAFQPKLPYFLINREFLIQDYDQIWFWGELKKVFQRSSKKITYLKPDFDDFLMLHEIDRWRIIVYKIIWFLALYTNIQESSKKVENVKIIVIFTPTRKKGLTYKFDFNLYFSLYFSLEIFVENRNFSPKLKFSSKFEIYIKNRHFHQKFEIFRNKKNTKFSLRNFVQSEKKMKFW